MFAVDAARDFYQVSLKVGNPGSFDPELPYYKGLTKQDGDLPEEFIPRLTIWESKVSETEKLSLLKEHKTFNSMIRALIVQGKV